MIDDSLLRDLKRRAAEEGRTLSDVTSDALRRGLAKPQPGVRKTRIKLPAFAMGSPKVDVSDRNALFDVLDKS